MKGELLLFDMKAVAFRTHDSAASSIVTSATVPEASVPWSGRPRILAGRQLMRSMSPAGSSRPVSTRTPHETGQAVFALLERLNSERGLTMVLVTHNRELAGAAGRRLRLSDGVLLPD